MNVGPSIEFRAWDNILTERKPAIYKEFEESVATPVGWSLKHGRPEEFVDNGKLNQQVKTKALCGCIIELSGNLPVGYVR